MRQLTGVKTTAVICAALLLSACGGQPAPESAAPPKAGGPETTAAAEPPAEPPAPTATPTETSQSPTATNQANPETAAAPGSSRQARQPCATANLHVAIDSSQGAAGSLLYNLGFTNTSDAPCTLTGFPGVSLVGGGDGTQLSAPAARDGAGGTTVTVEPGTTAFSALRVTRAENFSPEACRMVAADGLRIYPPNQTAAAFIPLTGVNGCAADDARLLSVRAVTDPQL